MAAEVVNRNQQRGARNEAVIYYRRPEGGSCSRFILWGDSQPGKRSDMMMRGFFPLEQYGRIWAEDPKFAQYGAWGPILTHLAGPAEFPAPQVLSYRWYTEEGLRASLNGNLIPGLRFPQLEQYLADGGKIVEYPCADCGTLPFLKPVYLARHLRNSHNWDRADILAWGAAVGMDLSKEFSPRIREVQVFGMPVAEPEPQVGPAIDVETVVLPTRINPDLDPRMECRWCMIAKIGHCVKHCLVKADCEKHA